MHLKKRPGPLGLYRPEFEHENCGVGFVAHMKGQRSHAIISNAEEILINMTHRGAVGSEVNTGDGAGILTAVPWELLERIAEEELGTVLPQRGSYAVGLVFLPEKEDFRQQIRQKAADLCEELGHTLIGWRKVPRDNSMIGPSALACEPWMEQIFIARREGSDQESFDRDLYILRKKLTNTMRGGEYDPDHYLYVCSLSTKILVYKGMLTPEQLPQYFSDLRDPDYKSHLAMVHSRFSTNTFPSWDRAQPLRYMSHNGEINTLRGNINKIRSREGTLHSSSFGPVLRESFPVIEPDLSDSGTFDNVLELLYLDGRALEETVMMMIPEAWENHRQMEDRKKAFYEYNSCIMEPWDGPASISFTDGRVIGAVLDRNGLRPSRYYVTRDNLVIMASEVGVLPVPPETVLQKGRLEPGRMFLVDFDKGRIVDDEEVKAGITGERSYRQWLDAQKISLNEIPASKRVPGLDKKTITQRLKLFGYTIEHLQVILKPMVEDHKEPLGSMGNDSPLAVLSSRSRLIYDYFKQLFAQVTNPPIDSIREEIIMSLDSFIGPEGNLLSLEESNAHRLHVPMPILSNRELGALKTMDYRGWRSLTIDITYPREEGEAGLVSTLDRITAEAEKAIADGYALIILSDRAASQDRVPVSMLLAQGAVHHHLVRTAKRAQIGIVLESGEPREVHHFCLLVGYGADAVNPYLALESLAYLKDEGYLESSVSEENLVDNYREAVAKGMRKVFGKMGISTLKSYKGAQIFEAVGLAGPVIDRCFAGTASRIEGADFGILAKETMIRHDKAFPAGNVPVWEEFLNNGDYSYREDGEKHMWDPESIANLQIATRYKRRDLFNRFCERLDGRSTEQSTLRGMLRFKKANPVPLENVEPAENIMKRFVTGAMSYGSISREAHETLAIAMNRIGGKSNTGEGGEDPERFTPLPNGDSRRSAIKQVASGRFGVTIEYLANSDEIQIKMAQGAKPGEGGELPGHKVFDFIAKTRHSTPGVGLISPPPHHDIYSIEDLAQLIYDLKNTNEKARISVKLVSEVGVGTIAAGVAKGHADHILISGHDGGTGASPLTGIKNAGLPWELGLAETHQTLVLNDLRSRVVLQTDGQLKTGRDVVIAAMLGAEEFGVATAALVTMGCIMMRKCHKNTCPVGIATQDPRLRAKFKGSPDDVVTFFTFLAEKVREVMASLGFTRIEEMVGRTDMLEADPEVLNWKDQGLDLAPILMPARKPYPEAGVYCTMKQDHGLDFVLDRRILEDAEDTVDGRVSQELSYRITNTDRTVGTILSNAIARRYGGEGLPGTRLTVNFRGSAGQSFGAWLAKGVSFRLEGDANDYVGKGLSGGTLIVHPPVESSFSAEENIIIGNVAFYGATGGSAFIRGRAAERFCVRNSGAQVVIEGVGDHGCEYMTGGRVVILGAAGRNFAAGMSGGIAYVYDPGQKLDERINHELVDLEPLMVEDIDYVRAMVGQHHEFTGSGIAGKLLEEWDTSMRGFRKVMPRDYKRVLMQQTQQVQKRVEQMEAVNG
ncbi:glutamate synthase large subunit [Marispirochaeta sp.]|uniref:glutamate synthase large subunit n=1 Tax=Marispirochaeta sp. TaxID=2038653 RepID=UPI0029C76124|nr:glutamate synthase large subunit [Marispirochaeta sp.]